MNRIQERDLVEQVADWRTTGAQSDRSLMIQSFTQSFLKPPIEQQPLSEQPFPEFRSKIPASKGQRATPSPRQLQMEAPGNALEALQPTPSSGTFLVVEL